MTEKLQNVMVKKDLKLPLKRQEYMDLLDRIIEIAYVKYRGKYTKNNERLSWGRLIVQAVSSGGSILKDLYLEDLERRIEKLENKR